MNAPTGYMVLDEVLSPVLAALPPEAAQQVIDAQLRPEVLARLEVLREKANDGTLSAAERSEYERFVEAMDVLALFKLKARRARERQSPP